MSTFPFDQPTESSQQRQGTLGGSNSWTGQQTFEPSYALEVPPSAMPDIDLVDNTDELWIFVDLPGFREEEIRIEGDESTLHVLADRPKEVEEGRSVVVNERPSKVERIIPLVSPVNTEEAKATFEDGVCKIVLPKASATQYQEIRIE